MSYLRVPSCLQSAAAFAFSSGLSFFFFAADSFNLVDKYAGSLPKLFFKIYLLCFFGVFDLSGSVYLDPGIHR
jgi:hypothetical protein